ncbi:hypothetical protein M8C21_007631 [Ambrosia artemisiifolia]|uniref:Uncharacterized protein n=1 Tax=Ambrosia artemisiifolia TaxID=4212 RepID=A0AAD5CJS1_AMBAR|nr:hypothetical protein M8C21_007631 [Ambrosia artemisiifolia]
MVINGHDDATDSSEYSYIRRHHKHEVRGNQCTSSLVKHIKAPVHLVLNLVRNSGLHFRTHNRIEGDALESGPLWRTQF